MEWWGVEKSGGGGGAGRRVGWNNAEVVFSQTGVGPGKVSSGAGPCQPHLLEKRKGPQEPMGQLLWDWGSSTPVYLEA